MPRLAFGIAPMTTGLGFAVARPSGRSETTAITVTGRLGFAVARPSGKSTALAITVNGTARLRPRMSRLAFGIAPVPTRHGFVVARPSGRSTALAITVTGRLSFALALDVQARLRHRPGLDRARLRRRPAQRQERDHGDRSHGTARLRPRPRMSWLAFGIAPMTTGLGFAVARPSGRSATAATTVTGRLGCAIALDAQARLRHRPGPDTARLRHRQVQRQEHGAGDHSHGTAQLRPRPRCPGSPTASPRSRPGSASPSPGPAAGARPRRSRSGDGSASPSPSMSRLACGIAPVTTGLGFAVARPSGKSTAPATAVTGRLGLPSPLRGHHHLTDGCPLQAAGTIFLLTPEAPP